MALPTNNIKVVKLYYSTNPYSSKCRVYYAIGAENFGLFTIA